MQHIISKADIIKIFFRIVNSQSEKINVQQPKKNMI